MKQVNFNHPGGFPLEQETLDRLQTAYRHELFGALKSHLGINPAYDYIVASPKNGKQGWAIIHPKDNTGTRTLEGVLYPIEIGTPTQFLKTTRTGTNLTYGTGVLQTAYFDYEAQYISPTDYANRPASPQITDALAVHYYDLNDPVFKVIKDIQTIEADINLINQSYLPLNGSKAMEGDLNLGSYKLSKLDIKDSAVANVRVTDFRLGSNLGRALVNDSTKLTLNYGSDWQNTSIGGKVYLENVNTTSSNGSLLVLDDQNQINKNITLIDSLINRITVLESRPTSTAIPKGMIALWGKPAPFPEGWEEYTPLRGRMPIGFDTNDSTFNTMLKYGGNKDKTLTINEIPPHTHSYSKAVKGRGYATRDDDFPMGSNSSDISGSTGGGMAFSLMNPYRVVHFIEYTGRPNDPTNPIGNLTISNISNTNLTLNWTTLTNQFEIANYLVFKDDILIATLGNVLSYNVSGLSPGTSYNFHLVAKDTTGSLSYISIAVSATTTATGDTISPTVPASISGHWQGVNRLLVGWDNSTDNEGTVRYQLFRKQLGGTYELITPTPLTENYYIDLDVSKYFTYFYQVRAIDSAGNFSDFSSIAEVNANPDIEDL